MVQMRLHRIELCRTMPKVGETQVVWLDGQQKTGMTFCWIPPGEFRMGSRNGQPREQPVHQVIIPKEFWLAEAPVTQEQYACYDPDHRSKFHGRHDHPVENVNWHQARKFCRWLKQGERSGSGRAVLPNSSLICQPKPSGNTPAAQAPQPTISAAMVWTHWRGPVGITGITAGMGRAPLVKKHQTNSASMTCMEMSGNGAGMPGRHQPIVTIQTADSK